MNEQAPKKGLSPLAWVGIGCLVLLLLGAAAFVSCSYFVAKKAGDLAQEIQENPARKLAELAVRANPNLELVETDEEAGTMTILDKSTGKVATFDYDAIAKGKFRLQTEEGEMSVDVGEAAKGLVTVKTPDGETRYSAGEGRTLPEWFPAYRRSENLEIGFVASDGTTESGSFSFESPDAPQRILEFYDDELTRLGFAVTTQTLPAGGILMARGEDDERTVQLTVSTDQGVTRVGGFFSTGG